MNNIEQYINILPESEQIIDIDHLITKDLRVYNFIKTNEIKDQSEAMMMLDEIDFILYGRELTEQELKHISSYGTLEMVFNKSPYDKKLSNIDIMNLDKIRGDIMSSISKQAYIFLSTFR